MTVPGGEGLFSKTTLWGPRHGPEKELTFLCNAHAPGIERIITETVTSESHCRKWGHHSSMLRIRWYPTPSLCSRSQTCDLM